MDDSARLANAPDASAAALVFGGYVAVAVPLLAFVLGDHYWFFADDWFFLTDRELGSADDLFRDHNGHWSTVPVVVFRLLYAVFGLRTYLPYQLVVITMHLTVAVLVRVVMRRAGVGPWIASAAAGALVLFGPGGENAVWAFQTGFTGGIAFGLAQNLLADHDGPVDRRDALALVAGSLALMSSGTGIPLVGATALTLLVHRGWRVALLHTLPLAAAYATWTLITHPDPDVAGGGRPGPGELVEWIRTAYTGVIDGLAHHTVVGVALVAVLVGGLALLAARSRHEPWTEVRRVAAAVALAIGGVAFSILTATARAGSGTEAARSSRYVYVGVALTLPLLAVAADELARRWRLLTPLLAALFLVALPANVRMFDDGLFGPSYHERFRLALTTVPRMPGVGELPEDLQPFPSRVHPDTLDLGFLLQADETGKLERSTGPVPPPVAAALDVRLTFEREPRPRPGDGCREARPGEVLRPEEGTTLHWSVRQGPIRLRLAVDGRPFGPAQEVALDPGQALVVRRSGVAFSWELPGPGHALTICPLR